MSGPGLPPLALGLPSLVVLGALVCHVGRNRGARFAALFFGGLAAYGALRSIAIGRLLSPLLGSPPPYLMERPLATVAGVSVQEIAGWGVAVTLSWLISDRLLRRAGLSPGPYRVAALAALLMAAVCLAVESAAVAAGWWTWTLRLGGPALLRVPPVALLDWGFVAFDFLLPALLFSGRSSASERVFALGLFPLHFGSHALVRPLPGPLPLTGWDLVHLGIAAWVLWKALRDEGVSRLPEPSGERSAWLPAAAALSVAGVAAFAAVASGSAASALGAVPLAALGLAAGTGPTPSCPAGTRLTRIQAALVVLSLVVADVAFLRLPRALRTREFLARTRAAAARLNGGDLAGAEAELRRAVESRPDNASGRSTLAWVLLARGEIAGAKEQLREALRAEPTSRDGLLLQARLDLEEGRAGDALARAKLGRRVHPSVAEFSRIEAQAHERLGNRAPPR